VSGRTCTQEERDGNFEEKDFRDREEGDSPQNGGSHSPIRDKEKTAKKAIVKQAAAKKSLPKKVVKAPAPSRRRPESRPAVVAPPPAALPAGEVPDSVRVEGRTVHRTREERRRQVLAVLISLMLIILALLLINRRRDRKRSQKLQKDAAGRTGRGQGYQGQEIRYRRIPQGIRKLDAALRILDRIQDRIKPEKKKLHRKLDGIRAAVRDDLKRLLLKEADRLQKLARQLDADGQIQDPRCPQAGWRSAETAHRHALGQGPPVAGPGRQTA
jgi:hypothetical protein